MPIRVRLLLAGLTVAVLAVGLFGFGVERLVALNAANDRDSKLAELADRAVVSIRAATAAQLRSGPAPTASSVTGAREPFTAIFAADGRLLFATARLGPTLPAARSVALRAPTAGGSRERLTAAGLDLRLHVRSWSRNDLGLRGVVLTGEPASLAGKGVTEFRWFLGVSGALALLIAALAAWVVGGRALRPLRELAATTDAIGSTGDLTRRLPMRGGNDLLAVLSASFNGMLDKLASSQRRLELALDTQRRFVADASHELRGPLTTIRSNAGFLLEQPAGVTERDRADALTDMVAEGERMSRIVDDLLMLARADGGSRPVCETVRVAPVVAAAVRAVPNEGRQVVTEVDPDLLVMGDADALFRLVRILIENAVAHGAGAVSVRGRRQGDRAIVSVSDDGTGFPAEALERAFDRFYQADPARSATGSGLGLAIARAIVDAHGGSVRADNRQGGGAVLTVDLPAT